jgi:hypothetical protein
MELADLSILDRLPLVEVLSLSINNIDTLRYFSKCTALRELYLRRNQVPSLSELAHLTGLENLRVLWLSHNPVADDPLYRATVIRTLPLLQKLDDTGAWAPHTPRARPAHTLAPFHCEVACVVMAGIGRARFDACCMGVLCAGGGTFWVWVFSV